MKTILVGNQFLNTSWKYFLITCLFPRLYSEGEGVEGSCPTSGAKGPSLFGQNILCLLLIFIDKIKRADILTVLKIGSLFVGESYYFFIIMFG